MQGRLKLREASGAPAELISYRRADKEGPKVSSYRVVPVYDAEVLTRALDDTLGIRVAVEKARRLILWRGVRIHLDTVTGLGTFVELEALAEAGGLQAQEAKIVELRAALSITDDLLVARGYADLLERLPGVRLAR